MLRTEPELSGFGSGVLPTDHGSEEVHEAAVVDAYQLFLAQVLVLPEHVPAVVWTS